MNSLYLVVSQHNAEMVDCCDELAGDVVYALRPESRVTSAHLLTSSLLSIGAQHTLLVIASARVKKGLHRQIQARRLIVASTKCHTLEVRVPRQAGRSTTHEVLPEPDWHVIQLKALDGEVHTRQRDFPLVASLLHNAVGALPDCVTWG